MTSLVDWKAAAGMLAGALIGSGIVKATIGWAGPPFGLQSLILVAGMIAGALVFKALWKEQQPMSVSPPLPNPAPAPGTRRFIETRKRGFFGYVFAFLFWAWNALMAWSVFSGLANVGQLGTKLATDAERVGHAAGATIGFSFLLMVWAAGAVVFGLLMFMSRGRREMIEVQG